MSTLVIIPMKDPAVSKTRLSSALQADERERLAQLLFENTLSFFAKKCPFLPKLVVTESAAIAQCARHSGAHVLREPERRGLNAALNAGTTWAIQQGYTATLIVAADVAVWEAHEIEDLFIAGTGNTVVIAEAIDGGTNALLLPSPNACSFRFGPGSAVLHEISAKERGYRVTRMHLPFLARDVDTPEDLEIWEAGDRANSRSARSS